MRNGRSRTGLLAATTLAVMALFGTAASPSTAEPSEVRQGVLAQYEGRIIDLSRSWEGARACNAGAESEIARCFDTVSEMDRWLAAQPVADSSESPTVAAAVSCASSVRLSNGTNYTGASLILTTRGTWLNLAAYGFNQRTSSYRVGQCSTTFADLSGGGGSWYPANLTQSYDQSPSMLSGWNNDVSSIWIH